KRAPALEAEGGEQAEARLVVAEDEADQGIEPEPRAAPDRLAEEPPPEATVATSFGHIDAHLGSTVVGGPAVEGLEAEPASHPPVHLDDPDRSTVLRMRLEPTDATLDRHLHGVGGGHAPRDGGVVDRHDRRQVALAGVAHRHRRSAPRTRRTPRATSAYRRPASTRTNLGTALHQATRGHGAVTLPGSIRVRAMVSG